MIEKVKKTGFKNWNWKEVVAKFQLADLLPWG